MPDHLQPTPEVPADLADLERRMAAFENATQRLNRTVSGAAEAAGQASPPRPATRRLSESGMPPREEISGLRPAVAAQGPVTGALTARNRGVPHTGSTGFTSAYGKPAIPQPSQAQPSAPTVAAPPPARRPMDRRWKLALITACALLPLMALASLPRLFPTSTDGVIAARTTVVAAPCDGILAEIARPPGSSVSAGDVLARLAETAPGKPTAVLAPSDGVVAAVRLVAGRQVSEGLPLIDLAPPGPVYAVSALSPSAMGRIEVGDRVEARLISDARTMDGTIAELVPAGATAGAGLALERDTRPRAIIMLDPTPQQPRLGQGVRVVVVGPRPGPVRLLALRLRGLLPW